MAGANPIWGAPRIHGELLKLGFEVSERIGFGRRRTATGRRQGSRGAQKQLALEFDRLFVEIEEAAEVCF